MPSRHAPERSRGFVVPIGGAEKKKADRVILERLVRLAGGSDARIAVIPTASELDDTGDRYRRIFEGLDAEAVTVLPITEREQAFDDECLRRLEDVTAVFLTGGNQLRLSTILGGTPVAKAIRRLNAGGVHVGGTSAGAAILSEHMIAGGASGHTPRADGVILAPGLGLTNRLVVDQHFRQRDRLGRLLTAVSFNPFAVGVGLDEDTALFLGPDDTFEVIGSGGVTVVDPTHLTHSSMDSAKPGAPVSLIGVTLHVLTHGARYDTVERVATAPAEA
ncbi:MAG: cyanophycinase [Rubricoccaceae bacterium]|nr:cyanophycinase [Rubricoccaceae bacterium]